MKEKEKLLELLDDFDVVKKIKKIFREESKTDNDVKFHALLRDNRYSEEDLQNRIEQCKKKYKKEYEEELKKRLENVANQYNLEISQMQSELKNAIQSADDMKRATSQMEHRYALVEKIYAIYSTFTPSQMSWFDRVLHSDHSRSDSPIELIVWATQKENLVAFWEIVTSHLSEITEDNQEKMFYPFFEACFNLYAETTRGKSFLLIPRVGEEYDPMKHSKTSESKSSGIITKVIFPGYCIGNEKNKPIVFVA